ncbi:MAG: hypothetical protein NZ108_06235, partial [Bacteroidia bacterium]|nr:hypothetical protein [Bacteroidia bacterium]
MASGKLTPRQKMINMMYLVLTALLALNVSAEILLSFKTLANSLRSSAEKFDHKNDYLAEIMNKELDKEANKNKAHLKPLIAELQAEKQKMIQYLQEHITNLTKLVGTDKETGDIAKPDELELNYNYWMGKDDIANGGRGSGKAKEMREKLNGFVEWANNWYETNAKKYRFKGASNFQKFTPLCVDPKDDPSIKHRETKNKTWEYYTFHGSPLIANIAMLEKFKNDVNTIESDLLEHVKAEIAEIELKIDSIIAIDAPTSSIVAAGLPFETQLFVAMSSKNIKPQFSGSGTITPEKGGQSAKMKIMANGNVIPPGKMYGEQPYSATIKVPKADGSFMVLNLKKTFKVAKPVIEVTSAALQIMYKDCANQAYIKCPALGEYYNPQITATEATVSI